MIEPVDLASLSAPAQKMAAAAAPLKLQEMAAKGVAPGIKPGEMVALLVVFSARFACTVSSSACTS